MVTVAVVGLCILPLLTVREQSSVIAYNHESPRRGENFVTRKIARGVARIGFLGPLGDYAVMGIQLAAEEINGAGGSGPVHRRARSAACAPSDCAE